MTPAERVLIDWADETPDHLGNGHRTVRIEPTGEREHPWVLTFEEMTERGLDSADWTTYAWQVFGETIAEVVEVAAEHGPPTP